MFSFFKKVLVNIIIILRYLENHSILLKQLFIYCLFYLFINLFNLFLLLIYLIYFIINLFNYFIYEDNIN